MKKNFVVNLVAGVYVATMGAILYIYKKSVDKQNAEFSECIMKDLATIGVDNQSNKEE